MRGSPCFRFLERDGLLACRCARSIAASVEKQDLAGDDFRPVAFAAAALRLVLAGGQQSFDIDLADFADEPADYAAA